MIKYLTGTSNEWTRGAKRADLGLLGTPAGSTYQQRDQYPAGWAADNGCFVELAKPGSFDIDKWVAWLEKATPADCLWATLPDVVGDQVKTWERSEPWIDVVHELGFPVAIVLQDGLELEPGIWHEILERADAVFIGGSTEWKLGHHARQHAVAARLSGLQVHMGRVNSFKRLRYADEIGCHTADGTYLNFGKKADREINTNKLFGWLDRLNG